MKKVLIADDSLFMRTVLKDLLSKDYAITEADTGKQALQQYEQEQPDAMLLDIVMPEGEEEGVRVLEAVRKADPKATVIMLTAVGQDAIIERCRGLGAKDYVTKPFDADNVVQTLKKHIA